METFHPEPAAGSFYIILNNNQRVQGGSTRGIEIEGGAPFAVRACVRESITALSRYLAIHAPGVRACYHRPFAVW